MDISLPETEVSDSVEGETVAVTEDGSTTLQKERKSDEGAQQAEVKSKSTPTTPKAKHSSGRKPRTKGLVKKLQEQVRCA